jgi:hypothetical protein
MAVARPHKALLTGEKVRLDATRSWSRESKIARYEWHFTDGSDASGAVVERVYPRAGSYSEILKITDARDHTAFDFATVDVVDPGKPEQVPISIHAAYWPTVGIQPGREITFKVRTFGTTDGRETWDFGDGSTGATTKSDGNAEPMAKDGYAIVSHTFRKPGDYLVRVERENRFGYKAVARLHIRVEAPR